MLAFQPQTMKTGNLPHLSCIKWKPEPLGMEFKGAACCVTEVMLFLEIQKGKRIMLLAEFANMMQATAACML